MKDAKKGWSWYRFDPVSYSLDTAHLDMLHDGAYRRLIDRYVQAEGLPADDVVVCRLVRAESEDERKAVLSVLEAFFEIRGGSYWQKRCQDEVDHRNSTAKQNSRAGKISAASRKATSVERASDERGNERATSKRKRIEKEEKNKPYTSGLFDAFWTSYPPGARARSGKAQSLKAWEKLALDGNADLVMRALEVSKADVQWQKDGGQYIPHASTWLNRRLWENSLPGSVVSTQQRHETVYGYGPGMRDPVLRQLDIEQREIYRKQLEEIEAVAKKQQTTNSPGF